MSYREHVAPYAAALRMVREAIGELFGPVADLESEEATLLRGPEPQHEAEALIAALQRIQATNDRRARIRAKIMARVHDEPAPHWLDPALGPCKIWDGPTSGDGRGGDYPRFHLDGQTVAVHITNWVNEHGYLPGKKQLDHLCRRRRCISDKHLEPVTHRQNQKRRAKAAKQAEQWTPEELERIRANARHESTPFPPNQLPPMVIRNGVELAPKPFSGFACMGIKQ